jgi:hypothetical protein
VALFKDGPLRARAFDDLIGPVAGTRERIRDLRARLLSGGYLARHEVRGDRRHEVWLGTPAQIDDLSKRPAHA